MFAVPENSGGPRWPLVRVAVGGETLVTLVGDSFLPLTVHWLERSVVCPGDGCPVHDYLPARGLYYLPVQWAGSLSLLELSSPSSSHLEQHCKLLHGGLRPGLNVRLRRRTKVSPLYCEVVSLNHGARACDYMIFASRVMALYKFPCSNPAEDLEKYEARIARLAIARLTFHADKVVAKPAC